MPQDVTTRPYRFLAQYFSEWVVWRIGGILEKIDGNLDLMVARSGKRFDEYGSEI
jgi:hypothetical protein